MVLHDIFHDINDCFLQDHNSGFFHRLGHNLELNQDKIFLNFALNFSCHTGMFWQYLVSGNRFRNFRNHCGKFWYKYDSHKLRVFHIYFHKKIPDFPHFQQNILQIVQSDDYIGIFEEFQLDMAHRHLCDKFDCKNVRCNLKVFHINFRKWVKFHNVQFGWFCHMDKS